MLAFQIGDIEVRRVVESVEPYIHIEKFFPDAHADLLEEHRHWLEPDALCPETQRVILTIQSYAVKTRHHTILIDTCVGCQKSLETYPQWHHRSDEVWLSNLRRSGIEPGQIDYVFCTHLHFDHCGWNTRLLDGRWIPTFPNAKYILSRLEFEEARSENSTVYRESVLPILEAGQVQFVETDFALDDNVWLTPTPGHTTGHVAVNLTSHGHRAAMPGDVLISPIQCTYPDWCAGSDLNKAKATETRIRFLEERSEGGDIIMTSHFPSPSVGRVYRYGDGFKFGAIKSSDGL